MQDPIVSEILDLNQSLLDSIAAADWQTYAKLCHPTLSCFEPEARGHLVEGMDFHHFYFELGGARQPYGTTMSRPHVRLMGDAAVVSYVRLNQRVDAEGRPTTAAVEETRVWQKIDGRWQHVHFHRSALT
jgi:ketosteroid isomerase-like protein